MDMVATFRTSVVAAAALVVIGCASTTASGQRANSPPGSAPEAGALEALEAAAANDTAAAEQFQRDRQAILAMAGDYRVTFDFTETVAFTEGYTLKDKKISGGDEIVRVVSDEGDFISLQHILVLGSAEEPIIVKHWRQDWAYEPDRILAFVGGNAWAWRDVPEADRRGAWSQTVYQVDDAPRYTAVARWTYENGLAAWEAPRAWRPLPRRDMVTRDDYHVVDAVNRHALTPAGWVHEQDNAKLVATGEPHVLVREIGVNTYVRASDFAVAAGDAYWAATADYWGGVRKVWTEIEAEFEAFALTDPGETETLYTPILALADGVRDGAIEADAAIAEAAAIIRSFVTPDLGSLDERLARAEPAPVETSLTTSRGAAP